MENTEFVGAKCLTISIALDCSRNYVWSSHPVSLLVQVPRGVCAAKKGWGVMLL